MSEVYESIMRGLQEAIEDSEGTGKSLIRRKVSVAPVKEYNAAEIRLIRKSTGMTQKLFAGYLGVSGKTVEAWEAGINHPSGAASRLLSMLEMDASLIP